jgi:hypothetical protein
LIRYGSIMVIAGVALFAWSVPAGWVSLVVLAATMQGGGFGLCWAFITRRTIAAARETDRERTAGALPTVQMLGYAIGAATAGIVANSLGFASVGEDELPDLEVAQTVAVWVFLAFIPLGLGGIFAAWRLARA